MVGSVPVGGDAPVTVQTMTNTLTSDVRATVDQIRRCEEAGASIMTDSQPVPWKLVVHGGAGVIERRLLSPELEADIRSALDGALQAGSAILSAGGSALDAVEAAARFLEDHPHFNAGRGSVFTYQGTIEMDAAIMDGATLGAGAVAGASATRNPVSLARAVMEKSHHVFLSRDGADQFSRENDLEQAPP
ncbi:MAG TPA: flavodoxin-dependent (E)-4-hydroxy-3-methylbut-2-enyl-diphosphate synthase, partial [Longimicrobium sp.]